MRRPLAVLLGGLATLAICAADYLWRRQHSDYPI